MSSPGKQESQLGEEPEAQTHRLSRKGPGSGVSRAPSMRSDWSKEEPPYMAEGERLSRKRPGSGVSRSQSMRSDWSKEESSFMGEGERLSRKETGSPSMRSDWSKEEPPFMAEGDREEEKRYEPGTTSCSQDKQRDLLRIFEVLEEKMVTFLKNELQRFKQILSPDYQETLEMKSDYESDAREGALKMALHFLCQMKHQDLADKLNENELNIICQNDLKRNLKSRYQNVFEGIAKPGNSVLLQKMYTDLYITEGGSGKVNEEHEVRQIEYRSKRSADQDKPIKCCDIFKPSSGQDKPNRRVLTTGVAGIGKTISVHKYILDWAEGKDNQEINFIFPLCFRELNLVKDKECSLMDLLNHFFPETKQLAINSQKKNKVLLVFDGLDECRLQLNFKRNESLADVTGVTSLDVLLTNLIKSNLLPSALIWITSRPAAASAIPPECVDLVTEVQGFNNSQKEEYFRKRINNESIACEIISHIKSSRSLHIMCHIPVFCWIAAMVLEMIYSSGQTEIPKTLTELYNHFLIVQTTQRRSKLVNDTDPQWNHELILHLGKLAYEQLEKDNLIFYEEDLRECGIDDKDATVFSGVCTQIFREESGIFLGTVFCFVHLTVQEYLAALYAMMMLGIEKKDIISSPHSPPVMKSIITLQKNAVDKALAHEDGHFDLFLRFLLGLSLESNQTLLHVLTPLRQIKMDNDETIKYIKEKIREASSSERMINLFYCLNELNDHSLMDEIQSFLNAGSLDEVQLSSGQWSALVFVLLTSDQNLDVFDLKTYIRSDEALLRLTRVVEESHTTLVDSCGLSEWSCETLASVLCKESSKLRHLDLSDNHIGDVGVKKLCIGLESANCALETLRLSACGVTGKGYAALAAALKSNSSHLEELDLRGNDPGDSGVKLLIDLLQDPQCKLKRLRVNGCLLTSQSCKTLASILCKESSNLRNLDLSDNCIGDVGVKNLCIGLRSPNLVLKALRVDSCKLTKQSCATLATILCKDSSKLRHLDLSDNHIGDDGLQLLCSGLRSRNCVLEALRLSDCGVTGEGYAALASALISNSSHLEELDLTGNDPGDSGVQLLTDLLQDPQCKLKRLRLDNCSVTEEGCAALASALASKPSSHLTELHLYSNELGDSGVKQISTLLR
ncbi:NACHT, LRR and PYD domains-containing protein 3-like, partial [Engraulis encrasicolus]|uniref:NACHT, LRR and PYD domains-containing protein 3-like n=1 Tax=Engraulis encrasicolus TaxID=184585 RepID=UPI002FCE69D1